jgi:calcium permeable stress-gated cation channel
MGMSSLSAEVILITSTSLAIGLQYGDYGWKSFAWVAGIPPFIIAILFKVYIVRMFSRPYRYYPRMEYELRNARVRSERGDIKGNRPEKRFGHPALHAELFTPMLHASMMPLLAQVYSGRLYSLQNEVERVWWATD